MFPYSEKPFAVWGGYFSSRANLKEYTRRGSHILHASTKLYGLDAIKHHTNIEDHL